MYVYIRLTLALIFVETMLKKGYAAVAAFLGPGVLLLLQS